MPTLYTTICEVALLPKSSVFDNWTGQYLADHSMLDYPESNDSSKTDYGKVASQFKNLEQKTALFEYKGRKYPAFHIPMDQEVDYGILQKDQDLYITRFILTTTEENETLAQAPEKLSNWEDDFELTLERGTYILFDSACHFSDLEFEEYPEIELEKAKYLVKTSSIWDGEYEAFVIHKLEKLKE